MKIRNVIIKSCVCLPAACVLFTAQPHAYAQNTTTETEIEFSPGTGPTTSVDPENPGNDEDIAPPVSGSLAIVSISDFNFGNMPVTAETGLYDITTVKPNIQVVDLRGSGTGWKVTAAVSNFTSGVSIDTDDNTSLPGAVIHIYEGRPNSLSAAPPPVQRKDLVLTTDNKPFPVITAADGAGAGLWVMRWYPDTGGADAFIQLEVPAGVATVGTHTATINWTLSDTP